MGRRPEDQPEEEKKDSADEEEPEDDSSDAGDSSEDAPEADPDWSAPPLARAERPEGREPRTRDLRAEE